MKKHILNEHANDFVKYKTKFNKGKVDGKHEKSATLNRWYNINNYKIF
jgi:hypothetical protein